MSESTGHYSRRPEYEPFAANLKKVLKEAGMSQTYFAHRMNVSDTAVCLWCTARREPSLRSLVKMCKVLGCSPDVLLGGV